MPRVLPQFGGEQLQVVAANVAVIEPVNLSRVVAEKVKTAKDWLFTTLCATTHLHRLVLVIELSAPEIIPILLVTFRSMGRQ